MDGAETKSYRIKGTDFRSLFLRTVDLDPVGQLVPEMSALFPEFWFPGRDLSFLQILTSPDEIANDFGRRKWELVLDTVVADLEEKQNYLKKN